MSATASRAAISTTRSPISLLRDAQEAEEVLILTYAASLEKLRGMRATEAVLARADDAGRGGYARATCGRRVENRTVVVYLEFPAMRPSASLSQGVVLVSRFAGEYRVWAQLH